MKIAIIYNFAQHYRTSIFKLIDKEFDCEWFFGDSMADVKKMDYSLLTNPVTEVHTINIGPFTFQRGVLKLLRKDYSHYLILPDTRSISSWLFLLLSKLSPRKKIYIWTHGWYGKESFIEKYLKKNMYRLPNGGAFLYGNYAKELMIKEGFNPDKLFVIHNSLAYEQQLEISKQLTPETIFSDHFQNSYPNLFFVGRLTPVKKLELVLEAMKLSFEKGNHYNLTLIGGGEQTDDLKHLANELGLSNKVWFYGPCYDERELSGLIYNADLCVAPGNIGLTAMHSLVFGTPAITHDDFKWQMPEFESITDGITGCFFTRGNVVSLSTNIDKWFEIHKDYRDLVRNACMNEIDNYWTPQYQLGILKKHLV